MADREIQNLTIIRVSEEIDENDSIGSDDNDDIGAGKSNGNNNGYGVPHNRTLPCLQSASKSPGRVRTVVDKGQPHNAYTVSRKFVYEDLCATRCAKKCYSFKCIELPRIITFEALAIKLQISNINIVCLTVYRPGSVSPTLFFAELVSVLEVIELIENNIILAGDINVHMEKHNDRHAAALSDVFEHFNLINRTCDTTHEKGGILDLTVTSGSFPAKIEVFLHSHFSDNFFASGASIG
ncbi:hypothetical protein HELRODRAFT_158419 [Helobdella robusta]|uniref:Endonuclease/exonuclease/phosphatase domain-containing protein n=1 Tax=Helobdella robusta TaxID=6412 RepID=T1EMR7_HELRO|nr:hypothetical protein HELRODRAFT_158419 [Helobdella robusta]ESO12020.1 hypothetical protein HELRODRAFT_158419 [Helobdella robusta]